MSEFSHHHGFNLQPNISAHTDTQLQVAAARRLLCVGGLQH